MAKVRRKAQEEGEEEKEEMTDKMYVCDNCERSWKFTQLKPIKDLSSRVDIGGIVPAGDCPKCGAFCYPENTAKLWDAMHDLFDILYFEGEKYNPDKEWDEETIEAVAEIVRRFAPMFAGDQAKEFVDG